MTSSGLMGKSPTLTVSMSLPPSLPQAADEQDTRLDPRAAPGGVRSALSRGVPPGDDGGRRWRRGEAALIRCSVDERPAGGVRQIHPD